MGTPVIGLDPHGVRHAMTYNLAAYRRARTRRRWLTFAGAALSVTALMVAAWISGGN